MVEDQVQHFDVSVRLLGTGFMGLAPPSSLPLSATLPLSISLSPSVSRTHALSPPHTLSRTHGFEGAGLMEFEGGAVAEDQVQNFDVSVRLSRLRVAFQVQGSFLTLSHSLSLYHTHWHTHTHAQTLSEVKGVGGRGGGRGSSAAFRCCGSPVDDASRVQGAGFLLHFRSLTLSLFLSQNTHCHFHTHTHTHALPLQG